MLSLCLCPSGSLCFSLGSLVSRCEWCRPMFVRVCVGASERACLCVPACVCVCACVCACVQLCVGVRVCMPLCYVSWFACVFTWRVLGTAYGH